MTKYVIGPDVALRLAHDEAVIPDEHQLLEAWSVVGVPSALVSPLPRDRYRARRCCAAGCGCWSPRQSPQTHTARRPMALQRSGQLQVDAVRVVH